MRFSRYSRLGAWVGIVCLSGIGLAELFRFFGFSSLYFNWGVGAIGTFGVVLLALQPNRYTRRATPDEILRFYQNPHYWGTALISTALLVFLLGAETPPEPQPIKVVRRAPPAPQPVIVEEPRVVTFPDFRVTAVVLNGDSSSAVVNGKELWIGEAFQGAKLVAVTETAVEFEKEGVRTNVPTFVAPPATTSQKPTRMVAAK